MIPDKAYKVPQLMFIPRLHQAARKENLKSIREKSGTKTCLNMEPVRDTFFFFAICLLSSK